MKRVPVGTARCCAGFPSPAEQYQEPLGLRLPSKADAFSADILDLNELLVKRPAAAQIGIRGSPLFAHNPNGGDKGSRTPDLLNAIETLYQLSYIPIR